MNPAWELTKAFLDLPYHERLEIAKRLELVEATDPDGPALEQCQRWFQRARIKKKRADLWTEVMAARGKPITPNPFIGMT